MIYMGEAVNANDFQSPRYVCTVTVPLNEDQEDPSTPRTGLREMHTCMTSLSPQEGKPDSSYKSLATPFLP